MTDPAMPVPRTGNWTIRPILDSDATSIATVIRRVMPEFGADGPGFALHDPEVDFMPRAYAGPRSAYFVLVVAGEVMGGAGIAPLAGGDAGTCELRKMYLLPAARGIGAGHALMWRCLHAAREAGYTQCYLETLCGMDAAMRLYERHGFRRLDAPMGATGHHGCDRWYLRTLDGSE